MAEAMATALAAEPMNLAAVIETALGELRTRQPDLAVRFDREIDTRIAVRGDPAQLAQVFRNLAENASHAMHGRGTVRISTERRGPNVEVAIDDEGPGIPAEVLPRIFEPFFTTKTGGSGTGLGLFVCYGIIKSHQGYLRAENRPEGGARFLIGLPVVADESARRETERS